MPDVKNENLFPTNRIETLCDGIFAITMTLIILDLKTPENIPYNVAVKELPALLYNLIPEVETYVLSFILLGVFWLRHQIQFKYIRAVNRRLIAINVIFLMLIGFVPFSVGLMMRYGIFQLPFIIYIINLFLISISLSLHWRYVSKDYQMLLDKEMDVERRRKFSFISFVPAAIYALSFLISFVSIRAAFYILILDPLFYLIYKGWQKVKTKH